MKEIHLGTDDFKELRENNWSFLSERSDILTVDFWHFLEYLAKAASAMFNGKSQASEREEWLEAACHGAKHKMGGVMGVLNDLKDLFSIRVQPISIDTLN
jgi:hypothetical protein